MISVLETSKIEVMEQAKVLDIAGTTLYIVYGEGYSQRRGFKIEGTYKDWDDVVTNGTGPDLKASVRIKVVHDPSGRQPLQVTMLDPPSQQDRAQREGRAVAATSTVKPNPARRRHRRFLRCCAWQ